MQQTPSDIFSAWIALEVLSPQTFRDPHDLATGTYGTVLKLNESGKLPWETAEVPQQPNYRLYYHVVLGTIDFRKAVAVLLDLYTDKREEKPAADGEAIVATIVLDQYGRPVDEFAAGMASFGWGLSQALKGNLKELSEWNGAESRLNADLNELLWKTDGDGLPAPLDKKALSKARGFVREQLALPSELFSDSYLAVSAYQYKTNADPPDPLFLNSFFIGDLLMARELFDKNCAPRNLSLYMGATQLQKRLDLFYNTDALEQALSPALLPPACWPGKGRHPLVVLQQAAVNLAMNELETGGILAVNGPPGTGKTTLLRDIVAGIVGKRAEVMCRFDDPATAFKHSGESIPAGAGQLNLYELDAALRGFEIVVASSNNKAVENVSAELPGLSAIADDLGDFRYFTTVSDRLLGRESWGLAAAVLGNSQNRSLFRQEFWWHKDTGLATYLTEASGTPQFIEETIDGRKTRRKPLIITEEDAPANPTAALLRWESARARFREVYSRSQAALTALENIRQQFVGLDSLIRAEADTHQTLKVETVRLEEAQKITENAHQSHSEAERRCLASGRLLKEHEVARPGFFARLFRTRRFREWEKHHDALEEKVYADSAYLSGCLKELITRQEALTMYESSVKKCRERVDKTKADIASATEVVNQAKSELGMGCIDRDFFALPHEDRHRVSPWYDREVGQLREEVFVEALRLHKAFIDAAAKPLKHNLGVLMGLFSRNLLTDAGKKALLPDLWSSLFLVVPAVSTTFASVERMLGRLPAESLGWLLIDEAGQALPQAAVGALIRTKRAVVVGDPLQIEPVVTLPERLTQNICSQFGVDPHHFNAPEASVQRLADAASPYYAEFEGRQGSRSVGVPLLVHRRCTEPMFGISNTIAYEHLMVQAKKPGRSGIRDIVGGSCWFDVRDSDGYGKWSQREGQKVLELLGRMRNAGVNPDIYIITPFVVVSDQLRRLVYESGLLTDWVENPRTWPYERIGTLHTV